MPLCNFDRDIEFGGLRIAIFLVRVGFYTETYNLSFNLKAYLVLISNPDLKSLYFSASTDLFIR